MELNEFIARFVELLDDTDASEITANTAFHDLEEWSSLVGMGVIAMAKIRYGKTITGPEIKACTTIEDLFNQIKNK